MTQNTLLLNHIDVVALLCKTAKKWAVFMSFDDDAPLHYLQANCPVLTPEYCSGNSKGMAVMMAENESQAWEVYSSVKGDNDNVQYPVYALIINDNGELLHENT